ncbi:hypothetical protein COMA2_20289 [Candidatus Nitrospira nitrificans]|uniref:Uncharacterized protein n=1 Tax=Candidatus Nitrospira nitrificans TaxID=1742973 RepID=A0A0S4LFZ5_9BACT|nr:hypothetical protein COMA2_20289 [Candidatus Nitrospira nitrificans]
MGIRFLEMMTDDKNRLSQVILSLLVGQSANLQLFSQGCRYTRTTFWGGGQRLPVHHRTLACIV